MGVSASFKELRQRKQLTTHVDFYWRNGIFKHLAVFYCRLSLRERMEKRNFRGAKGDTYLPHDA